MERVDGSILRGGSWGAGGNSLDVARLLLCSYQRQPPAIPHIYPKNAGKQQRWEWWWRVTHGVECSRRVGGDMCGIHAVRDSVCAGRPGGKLFGNCHVCPCPSRSCPRVCHPRSPPPPSSVLLFSCCLVGQRVHALSKACLCDALFHAWRVACYLATAAAHIARGVDV